MCDRRRRNHREMRRGRLNVERRDERCMAEGWRAEMHQQREEVAVIIPLQQLRSLAQHMGKLVWQVCGMQLQKLVIACHHMIECQTQCNVDYLWAGVCSLLSWHTSHTTNLHPLTSTA